MRIAKIMSTRGDPSAAMMQSIAFMVENWGIDPAETAHFLHGTTIATKAVLERKRARIGLLSTASLNDVLEIGRQMRQQIYSMILHAEASAFLAPGRLRKEVPERVPSRGAVLRELDETAVMTAADELVSDGVEAIAVCDLFSFLNPAHEQRTLALM